MQLRVALLGFFVLLEFRAQGLGLYWGCAVIHIMVIMLD